MDIAGTLTSTAEGVPIAGGALGDIVRQQTQDKNSILSQIIGAGNDMWQWFVKWSRQFIDVTLGFSPNSYNAEVGMEAAIDKSRAFDDLETQLGVTGLAAKLRTAAKDHLGEFVGYYMSSDTFKGLQSLTDDKSGLVTKFTGIIEKELDAKYLGQATSMADGVALRDKLHKAAERYACALIGVNADTVALAGTDNSDGAAGQLYDKFAPTTGIAAMLHGAQKGTASGSIFSAATYTPDQVTVPVVDPTMLKSADDMLNGKADPDPAAQDIKVDPKFVALQPKLDAIKAAGLEYDIAGGADGKGDKVFDQKDIDAMVAKLTAAKVTTVKNTDPADAVLDAYLKQFSKPATTLAALPPRAPN